MPASKQHPKSSLLNTPFLICVLLLGGTAVGLGPLTRYLKIALTKLPIPLRTPLVRLDRAKLGPYQLRPDGVRILEEAIVNSLGTDMYIDWLLQDTDVKDRRSPLRYAHLFVTYYTGQPDPVPHTPDACYAGAGYRSKNPENIIVSVPTLGVSPQVPVRVISFEKSGVLNRDIMTVVYTFHCNGKFAETRTKVRMAVNDPLDKYAYFSKVEILFGSPGARPHYASREDTIVAAQKLLSYILPVLIEDHWPDWDALKGGESSDGELARK